MSKKIPKDYKKSIRDLFKNKYKEFNKKECEHKFQYIRRSIQFKRNDIIFCNKCGEIRKIYYEMETALK